MTFDDIWNALVAKSGKLTNDEVEVTFKAGNLKKLLRQVYDQGRKQEAGVQKTMRDLMGKASPKNPMGDLFNDFFGGPKA